MAEFIESYKVEDYEVLTDTGWENVESVSKTIKYQVWYIETERGYKLFAADNHILFLENNQEVFIKDLRLRR